MLLLRRLSPCVALVEGIADAIPTLMFQAAVIVTDIALALAENIPAVYQRHDNLRQIIYDCLCDSGNRF